MVCGVAGLNRKRDEGENLLEPFQLVLERGCVSEGQQRWRRHGSECHELVEVDSTSDVRTTYSIIYMYIYIYVYISL